MPKIEVGTIIDIDAATPQGSKVVAKAKVIATDGTFMTIEWKDARGNTHRDTLPVAGAYDK